MVTVYYSKETQIKTSKGRGIWDRVQETPSFQLSSPSRVAETALISHISQQECLIACIEYWQPVELSWGPVLSIFIRGLTRRQDWPPAQLTLASNFSRGQADTTLHKVSTTFSATLSTQTTWGGQRPSCKQRPSYQAGYSKGLEVTSQEMSRGQTLGSWVAYSLSNWGVLIKTTLLTPNLSVFSSHNLIL